VVTVLRRSGPADAWSGLDQRDVMESAATGDAVLRRASDGQVAELYARVGVRAWRLARWILHDEQAASEVMLQAFRAAQQESHVGGADDAGLLMDVRRRAMAGATAHRRRVASDGATMRDAVGALSEPQRGVVELALFGDLSISSIATATDTPRADVLRLMVDALRALRIALALRGSAMP
jgi:DNA-directed RNA polymerase specialized sigma24 family protein